jgi:PKD repeat protein
LSLTITDPPDGAIASGSHVNVTGVFTGPPNTGITVNGTAASVEEDGFVANDVLLELGENVITATATAPNGFVTSQTITVTATGGDAILSVDADPTKGLAPLQVAFEYRFTLNRTVQSVAYDFDGDGIDDSTSTGAAATVENTYTTPGLYLARVTVTDDHNETHEATVGVHVLDEAQMTSLFIAIWDEMNDALIAGDVTGALDHVVSSVRGKYLPVFEALGPQMATIAAGYSPLQKSSISPEIGQFAVSQNVDGQDLIFFILFMQDGDGVWRIESM